MIAWVIAFIKETPASCIPTKVVKKFVVMRCKHNSILSWSFISCKAARRGALGSKLIDAA